MIDKHMIRLLVLFSATAGLMGAQTIALSVSPQPQFPGLPLTLTATVTGLTIQLPCTDCGIVRRSARPGADQASTITYDPTGTVSFYNNGTTLLGSFTIRGPKSYSPAEIYTITIPAASYVVSATYTPDAAAPPNQPVSSAPAPVAITLPLLSGLTVMPLGPYAAGQSVSLSVLVSPAVPSSSFAFSDNGNIFSTIPVNGSGIPLTVTSGSLTLTPGNHLFMATYTTTGGQQQVTTTINATGVPTTTTLTTPANNSSSTGCQPVLLTAVVTPNPISALASFPTATPPSGTVTFYNGTAVLGASKLVNGVATLSVAPQPPSPGLAVAPATNFLTAVYSGDATYLSSASAVVAQTVNAPLPISLAGPSTSIYGQSIALTVAGAPSGSLITFLADQTTMLGTATVNGSAGTASFATTALLAGTHQVTASYPGGCQAFSTAPSNPITIVVAKAPVTVTPAANPINPVVCQQVTLSAAVTAATVPLASGVLAPTPQQMSFSSSIQGNLGTGNTVQTSALVMGSHTITVTYPGDANYLPGSGTAGVVVNTPVLNLSALPATAPFGSTVTLTATIDLSAFPGTPVTVTFLTDGKNAVTVTTSGTGATATATYSVNNLAIGPHTFSATSTWVCSALTSVGPVTKSVVVTPGATQTTLAAPAPANPYACQNVTLTASVTPPGATGSVTFFDGSVKLGSSALTNGAASLAAQFSAAGSHSLTATYSSDTGTYSASTSAPPVSTTVNPLTLSVQAPAGSFNAGQSVTLTATGIPALSPGTVVTLSDATITLNATADSNGNAVFTTSSLAVGSHSLTASYPSCSGAVNAAPVTVVIKPRPTTITLSVSAAQSPCQPVTLTATVAPNAATGSVTFYDTTVGRKALGANVITNGIAALTIPPLTAGQHQFEADYTSADGTYTVSSGTTGLTIGQSGTTTSLALQPGSSAPGQPVTLTATITSCQALASQSPAVTGMVTFSDSFNGSTTQVGQAQISSGTATFSTSTLAKGRHTLTAAYSGDTDYLASNSAAVAETVSTIVTQTTLSAGATSSTFGQPVTLTATVTATNATAGATTAPFTGNVTFLDGLKTIGSQPVSGGTAILTISTLSPGNHGLTASYSGDSNYQGSQPSAAVSVTVSQAASTTGISVSPASPTAGQTITLTATVTASTTGVPGPTGTVTFKDSGTALGSPQQLSSSGQAVMTTSTLTAGSHTLTASYNGDTNYQASDSASKTVNVPPGSTTLQISNPVSTSPPTALPAATLMSAYSPVTFTATGGNAPYRWTLLTTTPAGLGLTMDPISGVLSGTPLSAGVYSLTVQVTDNSSPPSVVTGAYSLQVNFPSLPTVSLSVDKPQPASPTDNPTLTLTLAPSYPVDLTGTVTLSFTADPKVAGNPSTSPGLSFPGGSACGGSTAALTCVVTIKANSTGVTVPQIQIGTTAGVITLTLSSLTPVTAPPAGIAAPSFTPPPGVTVTLSAMVPSISSVKFPRPSASATSIQVVIDGTSDTRELVSAQFVFSAAQGKELNGGATTFTPSPVSLTSTAQAYFSAQGSTNGGGFELTITFSYSGDTSALGSLSVTLTNTVGTSSPPQTATPQ